MEYFPVTLMTILQASGVSVFTYVSLLYLPFTNLVATTVLPTYIATLNSTLIDTEFALSARCHSLYSVE